MQIGRGWFMEGLDLKIQMTVGRSINYGNGQYALLTSMHRDHL